MRELKIGSNGDDVKKWQAFLTTQGFYRGEAHGQFDPETKQATIDLQRFHEVHPAEGVVTNQTFGYALLTGYKLVEEA
jgi:peptidoglycan hydrolase-like protein with peptidoglycan-binding domain